MCIGVGDEAGGCGEGSEELDGVLPDFSAILDMTDMGWRKLIGIADIDKLEGWCGV